MSVGKTDRLIYDLTNNGGGIVITAYWAIAALYPELLSPENSYPWLNYYDRRVGPGANYVIQNNLQTQGRI